MDKVLSTKTFIISHLTILIIGLIIFGGLYYLLYPEKFKSLNYAYNPVTKEPTSFILEIGLPEDEILTAEPTVVVSGKTGPDATVIISNQETDMGLQASKEGQFYKVFPLSEGANIIQITAFDPNGVSKTVYRSVYYSKEKI